MGDEPNIMLSQRLSVMFMVLAIGCLMDIRLPSYSIEAEKYHQLARAALFQNNIFDEPTLGAVQALYLMSFYLFFSDKHGSSGGSRWAIMGMAVKLAQSVSRFVNRSHWAYSLTFFSAQIGLRESYCKIPCVGTAPNTLILPCRSRYRSLEVGPRRDSTAAGGILGTLCLRFVAGK